MYVKPLINSWKSLVRSAMIAEEKHTDDVEENGDISETNDEDGSVSSPPSTPQTSPNVGGGEESDYYKTGRAFTYSPPPDPEHKGSGSTQEGQSKPQKQHHAPPTPVPWSPDRKIFPPFVSRKERKKESEVKNKTDEDIVANKKKKERSDNDRDHDVVKSKSDIKSNSLSPKSRERLEDCSESKELSRTSHSERSSGKSKVLSKEAVDRRLESLHSAKKVKPVTSNVLLNDKLSSRSQSGIKRTVHGDRDKSRVKSQSQISRSKDVKKVSPKSSSTSVDASSLFQPDTHKPEKKSSGQKGEISASSGARLKRKASVIEAEDSEGSKEGESHLSEQVHKKRLEHKKKTASSKTEVDRKSSKKSVSPKTSCSGNDRLKPPSSKNRTKGSSEMEDSPDPLDSSGLSDTMGKTEERTYGNTGMSFEDCLFGGGAPVVKKKKTSPGGGSKQTMDRQRPTKHDGKPSSSQRSGGEKSKRERSSKEEHRGQQTRQKVNHEGRDSKPKKRKPNDDGSLSRSSEKRTKEYKSEVREVRLMSECQNVATLYRALVKSLDLQTIVAEKISKLKRGKCQQLTLA